MHEARGAGERFTVTEAAQGMGQRTHHRLTLPLKVGAVIALVVAATAYMYFTVFSHFAIYDDEGWMMIVLRHFLDGGVMYDRIPNVYGPFYYLVYGLIYGPLGVPLTTDTVRFVTMGHWLGSVALCCLCVWLVTRQGAMVALTFLGVLFSLTTIRQEPAHPQELCTLLFAAFAASAASVRPGRSTLPLAFGAAIATSLTCIKINVGVLATLAWVGSLLFAFDFGKGWRLARWAIGAATVSLPVILMRGNLDDPFTARFAGTMVLSVVCLLISQRHRSIEQASPRWSIMALAVVLPALLSCAFMVARGTSLHGIWEGLVLRALRFTGRFLMPLQHGREAWRIVWVAPIVLWGASSVAPPEQMRRYELQTLLLVGLKMLFGGLVFATVLQAQRTDQWQAGASLLIAFATPFLGLAILPPFAVSPSSTLARGSLCWFALLEVLVAYPVAGTQSTTGSFLFLPIAAICLADGLAWIRPRIQAGTVAAAAYRALAPFVFVAVAVVLLHQIRKAERDHAAKMTLDLPGARRLRIEEDRVATYRWLTTNLTLHADTFLSNIGLNSLFFWTGKPTPSDVTLSTVVQVFSDAEQHELMTALSGHDRSFFIHHAPLFARFTGDEPTARQPRLIRDLRDAYVDRGAVDGFHLLSLESQPPPALVDCCRWSDKDSFAVSIASRPGRMLARVEFYDLTTRRFVPLAAVAMSDPGDREQAPPSDGTIGPPLELPVTRHLHIWIAPGNAVAGHRFLLRLHDPDGRHFASLPFLDSPVPPSDAVGAAHSR